MIKACIVTIGDEILIGQTVDTNSAFIGQKLSDIGVQVAQILSIADESNAIKNTLVNTIGQYSIIIITGGLGPTRDDITKKTLADFFNVGLVFNSSAFEHIEALFKLKNREVTESNRQQAYLPQNATALKNSLGTASGMWMEEQKTVFISMPGVPYEMKGIMTNEVVPKLQQHFTLPTIIHKHILTVGIYESVLSEKLSKFEQQLPNHIKLAYLPSLGKVKLRLSGNGNDKKQLENEIGKLTLRIKEVLGNDIYGYGDQTLEGVIGQILIKSNKTIGTGESCTAGFIANTLVRVPGSSAYFKGSVVSYSNNIKKNILQVSENTLNTQGAVSEKVVKEMVTGVLKNLNVDYAIATSGIAGPDGGSKDKPVGTVWIGIGNKQFTIAKRFNINTKNRLQNIEAFSIAALNMLRKFLLEYN